MSTPQTPRSRSNPSKNRAKTTTGSAGEWTEVLLFYLLPFLLFNGILFVLVTAAPKINIQVANTKDYKTTTASITVQSLFPLKEFTSAQEGTPLILTETKKGHYTADITRNGVIEIYAKGLNGMAVTEYEHVDILDDVAPLVGESYSIQDGILNLTLEDSQSGVDYQSVFAIAASGQTLLPLSSDKQTGTFTFPMEEEFLIIYASDLAGNGMQATFSTHVETMAPDTVPAAQYPAILDANAEGAAVSGADTDEPAISDTGTGEPAVPGAGITEPAVSGAGADTPPAADESPAPSAQEQTASQPAALPTESEEEIMIHIRTH